MLHYSFFIIHLFALANVVSRCHIIKSRMQCLLTKEVKLDPRITKHIRIGRKSLRITLKNIIENSLLIFLYKIKREKRDI